VPRLIDRVLRNYPESDFSVRMKAELLFYVCIISFLCLPLIMVYTGYNQVLNTAPGSDPNFYVLIPHTVAMLLILVILHALLRGYYALSAHMLLLLLLFVAWMIMILERTSLLTRFDTVVYPVAFLSAVPLVVTRNRKAIPAYGILCFVLLTCFMWYSSGQLALPRNEIIEYMSDSTFAIIFTCMVAYSLFTINTKALNRAEHDISQRSKAEDDLRESQKQLMNVIDFLPDATLVIDNAKRVVVWNRAMERLTGVPSEEVLGKGDHCYSLPFYGQRRHMLIDFVHEGDDAISAMYPDFQRDGDSISAEVHVPSLHNGGAHIWTIVKPLYNADGQVAGAIGSLRDITERKMAEEERSSLEDQLRQAQKMESIGRMAGGIAHDFNNLLTAILGSSDLSLSILDKDNPVYQKLKVIRKAAESAADITRQLLAFSRKQLIEPKVIDLNELIDRVHIMLTRLIGEDIELRTSTLTPDCLIKADTGQIEQIIMNLAVNARDAMPAGGTLSIATARGHLDHEYCQHHADLTPGDYAMLIMSDTGSGMTDEVKEHLFEPFFTTKPKEKGTGLGLATIYGAVKQHRGHIEVDSEQGKGACFRIFFPLVHADRKARTRRKPDMLVPSGSETILLVEDNVTVLEFATNALQELGYTVIPACNSDEAIALNEVYVGEIHILVSDVILPGMNGKALADRLVQCRPSMEVLFTSGYTEDLIGHHGVLDEGIHFIGKPYTIDVLARKIREVIEKIEP